MATKLRILFGLGADTPQAAPIVSAFRALPEVDTLTFAEKDADVVYDFGSQTFEDIVERLPHGWEPDVVLVWSPEYRPIPERFEDTPYPTVGFVSDWNLTYRKVIGVMHAFDYLFTDKGGVEAFRRAGHEHVEPFLMFGFDPAIHRRLPHVEQLWDVGMVANLNHAVQRERSRWLARVAQLSDKYRVRIAQGLWGEEEIRALNESKITFNRSIRGEMNLRAYQAPACGSLLFLEEENLDVRDVYEDRVHCVLYNADNLEELVDYYLAHDDERERIVETAYLRVQDYSWERQAARWVERLCSLDLVGKRLGAPRLGSRPTSWHVARAAHAVGILSPHGFQVAARELSAALEVAPNNPTLLNNLGAVYGWAADAVSQDDRRREYLGRGLECLESAKEESPIHAVVHANLSEVRARQGDDIGAEVALVDALSALPSSNGELREAWLLLPGVMGTFHVEYERMGAEFIGDPEGFDVAARRLYRWWLCERIGDLRAKQGDWQRARDAYQLALSGRQVGSTRQLLARALLALGQTSEAVEQLNAAIVDEPFLLQARAELASALLQLGDHTGARKACEDALRLIRACPNYAPLAAAFESIAAQAGTTLPVAQIGSTEAPDLFCRPVVLNSNEDTVNPELIPLLTQTIFEDAPYLVEWIQARIHSQDLGVGNITAVEQAVAQIVEDAIRQKHPDAARMEAALRTHLARSEANRRAYSTAGRTNPSAVFWPNPGNSNDPRSLRTELPFVRGIPLIDRATPIVSMGSCFAMEIAHVLQREGFNYVVTEGNKAPDGTYWYKDSEDYPYTASSAAWGILFNCASFRQVVEKAFGYRRPAKILWTSVSNGRLVYCDPFREEVEFPSVDAFELNYQKHIDATRAALMEARVLIITPGLNEVWYFKPDGSVFSRSPWRTAPSLVEHKVLTVEENVRDLQTMLDILRTHNPALKVIVTLSPVPLHATFLADTSHIVVANSHSKAVLRVAVEEFVRRNDEVYYFPSYELITTCMLNPWSADERHVTPETVDRVMDLFKKMYC